MNTSPAKQELDDIKPEVKKKHGGDRNSGRTLLKKRVLTSDNLTPEQEAYCRGRALGMAKGEALAMAGISDANMSARWEKLPAVAKRISDLVETLTENSIIKTGLDQAWVISRLMTVTERCMQAEPVLVRGEGGEMVPSGEYKFDSAGANRALELLGKTLRMFDNKRPEEDPVANLSDEDIARIAAELAAETGLAAALAGTETTAGPQEVIEVQALPKAG